jgi:hypothetical protein
MRRASANCRFIRKHLNSCMEALPKAGSIERLAELLNGGIVVVPEMQHRPQVLVDAHRADPIREPFQASASASSAGREPGRGGVVFVDIRRAGLSDIARSKSAAHRQSGRVAFRHARRRTFRELGSRSMAFWAAALDLAAASAAGAPPKTPNTPYALPNHA